MRADHMSMVVDPSLALNGESRVCTRFPLRAILANQNQWFIEEVSIDVIKNASCSIIWVWASLPVFLGNWFSQSV